MSTLLPAILMASRKDVPQTRTPFRISLQSNKDSKDTLYFDCVAIDKIHAASQAKEAYPKYKIISVEPGKF